MIGDLEAGDGKVGLRAADDVIWGNGERRAWAESIVLKGIRVGVLGLCEKDARIPDGGNAEIGWFVADLAGPGLTRDALRFGGGVCAAWVF